MERGRILSLKRAIGQSDSTTLAKVVDELVAETEPVPRELVETLTARLSGGAFIDSRRARKLVIRTRSRDLYRVTTVRSSVLDNLDALIELLTSGIPDLEIENRLCERLISDFEHRRFGARQFILEALREHGSVKCLDALEMIEYLFHGNYETAKLLQATSDNNVKPELSQEFLSHVEREADCVVGGILKEAIAKIRERNNPGDDSWGDTLSVSPLFPLSNDYLQHAKNSLQRNDLGGALNHVRKAIEQVLKSVLKMQGISPKSGEPIDQLLLPALMGTIMSRENKWIPEKWVHKYLEILQAQSTMGSHDQGAPIEIMATPEMVEGAISTANLIRRYFEENASRYADNCTERRL